MTPSCKWPIQQEKIDVDHQVTHPREIYFGDGVGLLWKTVEKILATSFSVFYKFKFKLDFFILYHIRCCAFCRVNRAKGLLKRAANYFQLTKIKHTSHIYGF